MNKPVVKIKVTHDAGDWVMGHVYGHPRFQDGDHVHTSLIVRREGRTIETLNTVYEVIEDAPQHE